MIAEDCSNKEKKEFSDIIYSIPQDSKNNAIHNLNKDQIQKIKKVYAQKIINDTVRTPIQTPIPQDEDFTLHPTNSGFLSSICCCLYPQKNQKNFDITTTIFLKRFFGVFLICKSNFLKFGIPKDRRGRLHDDPQHKDSIIDKTQSEWDGRNNTPDLYGPMWMTLTYILMLGVCANLNDYFITKSPNYVFQFYYVSKAFGIVLIFTLAQGLLYKAIVDGLKGSMTMSQSFCLVGYSLILYFIPTILCVLPSFLWHAAVLGIGAILRIIFMFRNYGKFVEAVRSMTLLFVFLAIQALFEFVLLKVIFVHHKGLGFGDGTTQVFGHREFISLRHQN